MVYLDDIIFSLQSHGGVTVIWENLINALISNGVDSRFIDFRDAMTNKVRPFIKIPKYQLIVRDSLPIAFERFRSVKVDDRDSFVFHSSHYRICNNPNAINITTLHDFTYEYFFSGFRQKLHIWQKYNAIRKADVIVCISENTKRDLLKFLPDTPEEKIRIIYNGVSDSYHPSDSKSSEYEDCILFVGGRQSYKNFSFAVDCAKEVNKRLLIVGSPLSDIEKSLVEKELGKDGYISVVHPDDVTLNAIYNSVACLLYPSRYEGFGIPVVEAQKAGCPVIALNCSSIPEIIGDGGILLRNSSVSEFKTAFSYLSSQKYNLIEAGLKNSRRFSWNKMTSQYLDLYNELQK